MSVPTRLLQVIDRWAARWVSGSEHTRASPPTAAPASSAATTADDALKPQAALVDRLRTAYGYPEPQFQKHLLSAIEAYAMWFHCLPGPAADHRGQGGALRQALLTSLFSLQAADGRTFDGSDTEAPSSETTHRWRLACALGGLFAPVGPLLTYLEVVSEDGELWLPMADPLVGWLQARRIRKYHYRWHARTIEAPFAAVYVASRCIDISAMRFIVGGAPRIATSLLGCIAGTESASANPVSDVVHRIALAVAAGTTPEGAGPSDQPAALRTAWRQLFATSNWLPNSPGSPVWLGRDGMFVVWPEAAQLINAALPPKGARARLARAPEELLALLLDAGCLLQSADGPVVQIHPPGSARTVTAVRVASPQKLLRELGLRVAALNVRLLAPADAAPTPPLNPSSDAGAVEPQDCTEPPAVPPPPPLKLDTALIANVRVRQAVEAVVERLDQGFDTMLARLVSDGVFIALTEFGNDHIDHGAIVRALHDTGLLASDNTTPSRRVRSEVIEGTAYPGIVLHPHRLTGYAPWRMRWQETHEADHEAAPPTTTEPPPKTPSVPP